jgi:nucleoside-triphosphatase
VQKYLESLASHLARRSKEEKTSQLMLVTGDRGAGKTTWCMERIAEARRSGLRVSGLVSPPIMEAGQKVGIDLMDVHTNESRRLAVLRQGVSPGSVNESGIPTLNWTLDPSVFTWGNRILERLVTSELLVLDELGPLELLENKGLIAGLKCIEDRHYQMACVVVRPALLPTAVERWPWSRTLKIVGGFAEDNPR